MMPAEQYTYISSRLIKEVFALGGRVHGLVPELVEAAAAARRRLGAKRRRLMTCSRIAPRASPVADDEGGGRRVDRCGAQGVDVIDFGAGEPDFPTPEHVKAAAHAAIDAELHELHAGRRHRRAEAGDLRRATRPTTASTTRTTEVIVTAGGKQALYNTALALFGPGDEVITHAPCWPTIPEQVKLADATPVLVRTHAEDGFAIHAAADPRRRHAAHARRSSSTRRATRPAR